jgi:hypothetical protein
MVLPTAAKQQVQELQQERKQLQKKLAAYKQLLSETKAALEQHQRSCQQQAAGTADPAAAAAVEQLQLQVKRLEAELAAAQSQVSSSEKSLEWSKREAGHLQQLLKQQQEISEQLKAEVQWLRQQQEAAPPAAVAVAPSAGTGVSGSSRKCVSLIDSCMQTQLQAEAEQQQQQLQALRADCTAAQQQLMQARAECDAAKDDLQELRQQLLAATQNGQQQGAKLAAAQQQLAQSQADLAHKEQQLQRQQEQHQQLEAQLQAQLQESMQSASEELSQCRAELAASQAALQQLQHAITALEQQLAAVLPDEVLQQSATASSSVSLQGAAADGDQVVCVRRAADLVRQLATAYGAAQQAQQQLQQEKASYTEQLQQLVAAVERSEGQRQEAELSVLQLQQECQLLQLQLQKQQGQLSGRASMSTVVKVMEQLHAATTQQQQQQVLGDRAGAWGSSAVPLGALATAAAGAAAGLGTSSVLAAAFTPGTTPNRSFEVPPPASCQSPLIGTAAAACSAAAAAAAAADHGVGAGVSPTGVEMAQLRQRLMRLSQDTLANLPPVQQQALRTQLQQQLSGCSPVLSQSPPAGTPAAARYQLSSSSGGTPGSAPQIGLATVSSGSSAAAAAAAAAGHASSTAAAGLAVLAIVDADAPLQQTWQWLQQQAAGHDRLMQHMKQMWAQVGTVCRGPRPVSVHTLFKVVCVTLLCVACCSI